MTKLSSPYSWLSTNHYKSYNWNEIYKSKSNSYFQPKLINMVCNNKYIYLLVQYTEKCYILFSKNTINDEENTFCVCGKSVKLYCLQISHTDECVVISDTNIYLYKNGENFIHEYLYTLEDVYLTYDKLIVRDEFKMQYSYTFSQNNPNVKPTSLNIKHKHLYTFYDSTRIDIKGDYCRLTHIDETPQYHLIRNIYPTSNPQMCISNKICAIQTGDTNITYLIKKINIYPTSLQ